MALTTQDLGDVPSGAIAVFYDEREKPVFAGFYAGVKGGAVTVMMHEGASWSRRASYSVGLAERVETIPGLYNGVDLSVSHLEPGTLVGAETDNGPVVGFFREAREDGIILQTESPETSPGWCYGGRTSFTMGKVVVPYDPKHLVVMRAAPIDTAAFDDKRWQRQNGKLATQLALEAYHRAHEGDADAANDLSPRARQSARFSHRPEVDELVEVILSSFP